MQFFDPCEDFPTYMHSKSAKDLMTHAVELMENEDFQTALRNSHRAERIEANNPIVVYAYNLTMRDIITDGMNPEARRQAFQDCYGVLKRAIELTRENPRFAFFENITLSIEVLGYFHASYALALTLLQVNPQNVDLLLTAGYAAYQLLRPFKQYLIAAGCFDPARTHNFLTHLWIKARFATSRFF